MVTFYQCREQKAANEACRQAEHAIKKIVEFSLPWALLLFLKSVLTIFLSWKNNNNKKQNLMISPCWKCYSFMKSFSFHQPIHRMGGFKILEYDAKQPLISFQFTEFDFLYSLEF